MTAASPQLISLGTAARCLSDSRFYEALPEFLPLRAKMSMQAAVAGRAGCSSCAKRRMQSSAGIDFIRMVRGLEGDRLARFKAYIGAETLLVNGMNAVTKRFESRVI